LESDTGVIAVEVAVLDKILDGIDHLIESGQLRRDLCVSYRPSSTGLLARDVLPALHPSSVFSALCELWPNFGQRYLTLEYENEWSFCGSELEDFVRRWGGVRELIVVCGSEGRCGRKRAGKDGRVVRVKWCVGSRDFSSQSEQLFGMKMTEAHQARNWYLPG
jgi:hypothetical protein